MSLASIREALAHERDELTDQLERLNKAIAVINGGPPTTEGIERWGDEAVTCPTCGFTAKAPQGLSAHIRSAHN